MNPKKISLSPDKDLIEELVRLFPDARRRNKFIIGLISQHLEDRRWYDPQIAGTGRDTLGSLSRGELQRHPLIIGFVGAIGVNWEPILREFVNNLRLFNYETQEIHLSTLVDQIDHRKWSSLPTERSPKYYRSRMDACDKLREIVGTGSALAAMAISEISHLREKSRRIPVNTDGMYPEENDAYLLKSLKHPEEVMLLRHVYGEAFYLVGIASSPDERRKHLANTFAESFGPGPAEIKANELMSRDESDVTNQRFGQNVRDTYFMSDVFIPVVRGRHTDVPDIQRFIRAVFGDPFLTPRPDEEGMNFAKNAAMRSAALGRQVGAALIPKIGTPVVAGVNEVPKPGGGQYWIGDDPDYRDFRLGYDPNTTYVRRVIQEVLQRLKQYEWLTDELCQKPVAELVSDALKSDEERIAPLAGTRVSSLIEFTRCLHAEQATIINAARAGIRTEGAILYTTTFPCHECAKMIIGAGIAKVLYIEPYPKSLVETLYEDMINTSPLISHKQEEMLVIPFYQFTGIAPRLFSRVFVAGERKIEGELVVLDEVSACPIGNWSVYGVAERETITASVINRIMESIVSDRGGAVVEISDSSVLAVESVEEVDDDVSSGQLI